MINKWKPLTQELNVINWLLCAIGLGVIVMLLMLNKTIEKLDQVLENQQIFLDLLEK
jgi:hypothetical protein